MPVEPVRLGPYMVAEPRSTLPRAAWTIKNAKHRDVLGVLEWYAPWRRYVLAANDGAVWSPDCLRDVAGLCERLTRETGVRGG